MTKKHLNYIPNDTTRMFDQFNTILYIFGLPKFWIDDVKLSKKFLKIYDSVSVMLHVMTTVLCIMLFGSIFTQKHLTSLQKSQAFVIGITNPVAYIFSFVYLYYRSNCREVFYYLAVVLKEVHNDQEVERAMIRKLKFYMMAYSWSISMLLVYYGVSGLVLVIRSDEPFVTLITAWPDVTDRSAKAAFARIFIYIFWYMFICRISVSFILLLSMLIGLSHQYKNLKCYFESLINIFEENLRHKDKEAKFIIAFAKGIQSHADTIWCTRQCQLICGHIFNVHVLLSVGMLIVLLPTMLNSKHGSEVMGEHLLILLCMIIMGFFMWNAGDITVEACRLPDAIYSCGWHNCYGESSKQTRSLVVLAMAQAQQPIVLTAFGFVELSYETYVAMIKSAYSVLSVFY